MPYLLQVTHFLSRRAIPRERFRTGVNQPPISVTQALRLDRNLSTLDKKRGCAKHRIFLRYGWNVRDFKLVRSRRLELPRLAALPPQGSASTNSATTACRENERSYIELGDAEQAHAPWLRGARKNGRRL